MSARYGDIWRNKNTRLKQGWCQVLTLHFKMDQKKKSNENEKKLDIWKQIYNCCIISRFVMLITISSFSMGKWKNGQKCKICKTSKKQHNLSDSRLQSHFWPSQPNASTQPQIHKSGTPPKIHIYEVRNVRMGIWALSGKKIKPRKKEDEAAAVQRGK